MARVMPFAIITFLLLTVSLLFAGSGAAQGPTAPPLQEGLGSIQGFVNLQGAADNGGATVRAAGRGTVTQPSGEYVLANMPAGIHTIKIIKATFLTASREVEVRPGQTSHLPEVFLLWGDLDNDGRITIFELATISQNLGRSVAWEGPVEYTDGV